MSSDGSDLVEETFRASSGAVTASLIRFCGDFGLAEDAVQEAFVVATARWKRDGVPPNPSGWIATTAKRHLIDRLRSDTSRSGREEAVSAIETMPIEPGDSDEDRLRLIFTCCHPALPLDFQVALTLRTISGLSTGQIAEAFLVPESTMAKRLVRGKRKIKVAAIPYEIPAPEALGNRLPAVLAVVYLVFSTGYEAVGRQDRPSVHLIGEALTLAASLDVLIPHEPEIMGLRALMLMHDARSSTRVDAGETVLLDQQDRTGWDRPQIEQALELVGAAPHHGPVGQYWLQAAIAAEHLGPSDSAHKDWRRIVALYDRLIDHSGSSPIVQLNRAIALAEAHGPTAGLVALEPLTELLADYVYFHAATAQLNKRGGNNAAAAVAYRRAIAIAPAEPQRASLTNALKEIEEIL